MGYRVTDYTPVLDVRKWRCMLPVYPGVGVPPKPIEERAVPDTDLATCSLRADWQRQGRPEDHPYVLARLVAAYEDRRRRTPVVVGVGTAAHGQAAGLVEAGEDLARKLGGHDGSHHSCRACTYVRSLGAERAVAAVPEAFGLPRAA